MWEVHLLPFLLWFSWEDIKKREIEDMAVYALFWMGILINFLNPRLVISLPVTLAVLLPLHLAGVFAVGDLWIGLIVAAHHPLTFIGPAVVIGGILLGAVYSLIRVFTKKPKQWIKIAVETFSRITPFGVHPLLGLLSLPITKRFPFLGLVVLPFSNPTSVILFTTTALVVRAVFEAPTVFTMEKKPEEGDIPAEVVDEKGNRYPLTLSVYLKIIKGEMKPVHSLGADGLTKADVERLKALGIEKIKVREPLPLIPFITLAYVIIMGVTLLGMWPFS